MNDIPNVSIIDELGGQLREASAASARAVWIAPYAKKDAVEWLIEGMRVKSPLTLVTRWHPEDIARGVADTAVFDVVMARPDSELLLHPSLHAKVFLCGDTVFIGSANLTGTGLGLMPNANVELSTRIQPIPTSVRVFINRVIYESTTATLEIKAAIEEQASQYKRSRAGVATDSISPTDRLAQEWRPPWLFPQLRAPDRLFAAYRDSDGLPTDVQENAFRDLAVLNPPPMLEPEQFHAWVGSRLLEIDIVARFDEFVATPRRFGEMAAWFRSHFDRLVPTHDAGQRVAQQMIRWLTFFLPNRYTLETPNYSEVFCRNT